MTRAGPLRHIKRHLVVHSLLPPRLLLIKYFAVKVLLLCADMMRVGPLQRIDRALVAHSLHSSPTVTD